MAPRDALLLISFLADVVFGMVIGGFLIREQRRLPPEQREGILGTLILLQFAVLLVLALIYAGLWLLLSR